MWASLPFPVFPCTSTGRQGNLQRAGSAEETDWCQCSSVCVILWGSNECQCKGGRRGNLPFRQQSVITLALWFHKIVSVSYTHICNFLESWVPALSWALPLCQLLDTQAGRGDKLSCLWASEIFLEISKIDGEKSYGWSVVQMTLFICLICDEIGDSWVAIKKSRLRLGQLQLGRWAMLKETEDLSAIFWKIKQST